MLAKNKELFEECDAANKTADALCRERDDLSRQRVNIQAGAEALKQILRQKEAETEKLRAEFQKVTETVAQLTGYYSQSLNENRVLQQEVHKCTLQLNGLCE